MHHGNDYGVSVHWTDQRSCPYVRGMPAAYTGASTTVDADAVTVPAPDSRMTPGGPGYRRMSLALFLAGVATFALLYSTQALLPLVSRDFGVTASAASWTVSGATGALALFVLP